MKKIHKDSLIMHLETRLVDHAGIVDTAHMNIEDMDQAMRWNDEGLIQFKRRKWSDIEKSRPQHNWRQPTHWVRFTDKAWEYAHKCRREKADRVLKKTYCRNSIHAIESTKSKRGTYR